MSASSPNMEPLSAALLTPADLTGQWTEGSAPPTDGDQAQLITYNLQYAAAADALAGVELRG